MEAKLNSNKKMINDKNHLDVINFTNIDDKDFEGTWGGETTIIKVGETKPFPRFLAYHYAKHLINKILLASGQDFGDELQRKPLEDKIIGIASVSTSNKVKEEVVEEKIEEKVESEVDDFVDAPIEKSTKIKSKKVKKEA